MKTKSWRTTAIGWIGIGFVLISLLLVALGKATLKDAFVFGGGIPLLLNAISSFFSKDAKVTHSKELEKKISEIQHQVSAIGGRGTNPDKDEK